MSQHPISVTISGQTVDEVREKLVKLAREFGHDDRQESFSLEPGAVNQAKVEGTVPPPSLPETAPEKRRGRPPKAAEQASAVPTPKVEAAKSASDSTPSKEDALKAAQALQSAVNTPAVIATVNKFGVTKVGDVKESDRAAFIAECQQQIAGANALS